MQKKPHRQLLGRYSSRCHPFRKSSLSAKQISLLQGTQLRLTPLYQYPSLITPGQTAQATWVNPFHPAPHRTIHRIPLYRTLHRPPARLTSFRQLLFLFIGFYTKIYLYHRGSLLFCQYINFWIKKPEHARE